MTYEEMLEDTIKRIKQADMADLSAIHEYLIWSQGRYGTSPLLAEKLTPAQHQAAEERSQALVDLEALEAARAQEVFDQDAGLLI